MVNGVYIVAVIAHCAAWPKRWRTGIPLLTECEGLSGCAIAPYNLILCLSGVTALGGLYENRNTAKAAIPILLAPTLIGAQHWEFARLRRQARRHPTWWNRRLQAAPT